MIPDLRRLAILSNVGNAATASEMIQVLEAARTLGLEVVNSEIRRSEDITPAIESLKGRADAIYVQTDPLMNTNRGRISTLALGARLPTMGGIREYVEAGGLMSYGPNFPDLFRRAAEYVDKILRGAKPGDLPVEQPTKFDSVVNLTTAKVLGLKVPERRRGDRMRTTRRAFITMVGGATMVWPLAARAQQSERVYTIGILASQSLPPIEVIE